MESRIIYHIDKFVAFLFGEKNKNDKQQRIYNKLLRLEEKELENWVNEKLKNYITFTKYLFNFQGDEFEGIDGPTRFELWYTINYLKKNSELMRYDEIYDSTNPEHVRELHSIKLKLRQFESPNTINYNIDLDWKVHIMTDYMKMYIMTMTSEDLKSYIIQQVDPIEIK
jgi:succinate dehydrogenase flavin-adding protein (antitoxin of CptAB toxin-antitoxin module)